MKYITFLFIICLFESCYENPEKTTSLIVVDFEKSLNMECPMNMSDVADTIEYLELKTPKDIIVTRITNIMLVDNFWIIHSIAGICKFTKEGEFIKMIGKKGQGPGEYLQIRGIDYDSNLKELLVVDAQKILFYDLDGSFLRDIKIVDDYFYNTGISDSVLWTGSLGLHQDKHQVYAFNHQKDTLCFVPNPNYGIQVKNTDGVYFSHSRFEKEFYRYNENLYLKNRPSNDTVFRLSANRRYPYIVFDMGKYKLPLQYEAWFSNIDYEKYASSYWGIPSVAEDNDYLFLLAQRRNSISKNPYEKNEDDWRYIAYDKKAQRGFCVKGKIQDDILGGPAIWPRFCIENYYISTIEWYELFPDVKAGVYKLSPDLKRQFDSFNHGTNELLVICKKKN